MNNNIILKAENISKQYRLGVIGTGTISHDLNRWWHTVRGKEDPYLKIGESNDRATKGESEFVWALKDINFEVKRGEVLGIIGKNGAGKSTLLKILSRVTGPTTGVIKSRGRIASLLEVGTGFHPELTGRENIFLNGAILGMTKAEISTKLDEIVEFSGVERYIDTPVKRYSSGMRVRLAFAVAAFLEPDILVVDEVLAVGDAEFQKKAIGKMQDISKGEGRTVLFVSHNMASIKKLCPKSLILKNGSILNIGDSESIIKEYIDENTSHEIENFKIYSKQYGVELKNVIINENKPLSSGKPASFIFEVYFEHPINNPSFTFIIKGLNEENLLRLSTEPFSGYSSGKCFGKIQVRLDIPFMNLSGGRYSLYFGIALPNISHIIPPTKIANIDIRAEDVYNSGNIILNSKSYIVTNHKWNIDR